MPNLVNIRRVEQLMKASDARPYKHPSRWGTAWYKGPALDTANRMHGDALQPWYDPAPYSRTDWWYALTAWAWIAGEEDPNDATRTLYAATNSRIQIRNMRLHVRRSAWSVAATTVAPDSRNYSYTVTGGSLGITDRSEAANGGGMSYKLSNDAQSCPHPFGPSVGISDPWNVTGIACDLEYRAIMDNAGGTDDRALAKAVIGVAVDLYPYSGAPEPYGGYWLFAVAAGFARVTSSWQYAACNSYFAGSRPRLDHSNLPAIYTSDQLLTSAPADWFDGGATGPTNPSTPPTSTTAKRIGIFGDSLTAGDDAIAGRFRTWRGRAYADLVAAGYNVDFVGTQSRPPAIGGDPDCDAWGGAFISHPTDPNNLLGRVDNLMASAGTLDALVLYIGWNDVYNYTPTIADRYLALFDAIRAKQPSAKIVVCTLTPQQGETEAQTAGIPAYAAINARVRWVTANRAGVTLADLASLPMVSADYWDVIHYLQPGADKVGARIAQALIASGVFAGSTSGGTGGGSPPYVIPNVPKQLIVFPRFTTSKMTVAPAGSQRTAPTIRTGTMPNGTLGVFYSVTFDVAADPAATITSTGTLPAGLTRTGNTVSGTPSAGGTFTYSITADNGIAPAATQTYTFTIGAATSITTPATATLVQGQPATIPLTANGVGPFTWAATPIPAGMAQIGPALVGTPTAIAVTAVGLTAVGASGAPATSTLTITVVAASNLPVITTTTLPSGTVGASVSATIAATGAGTITRAVVSGAFPPGWVLNPTTGGVSGSSTVAGGYGFTIRATNAFGYTEQTYYVVVAAAGTAPVASPWAQFVRQ